jgi:cardiolipin synthase (CMP-forming)
VRDWLRHIPNALSGLRLMAAPVVALLILKGYDGAALVVFAAAGLSDALDGYLAKTFSFTSPFGAVLDPAADKLLMLASFLTLAKVGAVPWWLTVLVIGRDVAIVSGIVLAKAVNAPLKVAPLIVGKASTVVLVSYVAIILVLVAFAVEWPMVRQVGQIVVVVFTVWSLGAYANVWLKAMVAGGARAS